MLALCCTLPSQASADPQFELENNWLMWISFLTWQDEGMVNNLEDNFTWMQQQGYTHLRFFGIYPNGQHTFPSPTLNANGFPHTAFYESILPTLMAKANEHGISINFDGWEILATSNRDTTQLGVGYLDEEEVAQVVREVMAFGVERITEEQFDGNYLRAIQEAAHEMNGVHETTSGGWWTDPTVADEQLANIFTFCPYTQEESDYLGQTGSRGSNLSVVHLWAEGAHHYGYPFSVAAGSFGLMDAGDWHNALIFAQLLHLPERFSVEEHDSDFIIGDPNFNFLEYIGNELIAISPEAVTGRPMLNYVVDTSVIPPGPTRPATETYYSNAPAVVNACTALGYRVVTSIDAVLPGADAYFLALAGGANSYNVAPLPDYVPPLLAGDAPVFVHPLYGIPDETDGASWLPLREYFGLPSGETQTLLYSIPATVDFEGAPFRWKGMLVTLPPVLERLYRSEVDSSLVEIPLSAEVQGQEVAFLLRRGNKVLINSNLLHLEAASILSTVLGGPLHGPFPGDVATSEAQCVLFAEHDGRCQIDLLWTSPTRVRRWEPNGDLVEDQIVDLNGTYEAAFARGDLVVLTDEAVSAADEPGAEPNQTAITMSPAIVPNPSSSSLSVRFSITRPAMVDFSIYDVTGRLVRCWPTSNLREGSHSLIWDGRDHDGNAVAAGRYFGRLQVGEDVRVVTIGLVR